MKIEITAENFTFSQQITEEEKRYIVLYLMRDKNDGIKALAKEFVAEQEFKISAIKEANKQEEKRVILPNADFTIITGKQKSSPAGLRETFLWAPKLKLNKCKNCGTDKKNHMGKGFCTSCYFKCRDTEGKKEYVPSERAEKIANSQKAFNDHIESSVIMCANINCHDRLVKGIGVMYKEQEYHSNACLESFLNDPEVSVNGISI